jgi:translocator protein
MKPVQIAKLVVAIALPLTVGGIAGMFTTEAIPDWYATLNQPSFNPPNWIFGPVWTLLYILMGISIYLIWNLAPGKSRQQAMAVFLVQLLLNFAWSFCFFYFKRIDLALVNIVLLWGTIVFMLNRFNRLKPMAAYINIPYLLWVTFAAVLNAAYFILNR